MTFYPLVFIVALLHAFIGWRLAPDLSAPWGWVLGVGLVLSTVLMPLGLVGSRVARQPWADRLSWVGLLLMGLFSTAFVLTALRDVLLLAAWGVDALGPALPITSLRTLSAQAKPMLALVVTALGFLNARRTPAVVRIDVPIAGLPAALEGFTLAQISDIHVGPTIKSGFLQRVVAKVNTLGADVVAITGDLVDGKVAELARHVAPLGGLQSRHGTFFVTGNHEYYSGAHAWIAELRRLGLTVLINEHVVLDGALVLAGVADYSAHHFDPTHRSDPAQALRGAPPAALDAGFDLQLSGHTHGGQFWPWNLFVPLQQPFTAGLNRLQKLWVYTSRGTRLLGPTQALRCAVRDHGCTAGGGVKQCLAAV